MHLRHVSPTGSLLLATTCSTRLAKQTLACLDGMQLDCCQLRLEVPDWRGKRACFAISVSENLCTWCHTASPLPRGALSGFPENPRLKKTNLDWLGLIRTNLDWFSTNHQSGLVFQPIQEPIWEPIWGLVML